MTTVHLHSMNQTFAVGTCSVPEIGCLNSAVESPGSQGARAQVTCVSSASDGNAARRDESTGEW